MSPPFGRGPAGARNSPGCAQPGSSQVRPVSVRPWNRGPGLLPSPSATFNAPRSHKAVYIGAMTTTATGPVAAEITQRLVSALSPTRLVVTDDTEQHRGHAGHDSRGESHFTVEVESAAFAGLNRVARQRLVNHALAELLAERVHALAIRAKAPGEEAA